MATWFLNDPVAVYKKFNETKVLSKELFQKSHDS
jgi:hypothetical protein